MKEIIINGQQISRVLKDGLVVWSKTYVHDNVITLNYMKRIGDRYIYFTNGNPKFANIRDRNNYIHYKDILFRYGKYQDIYSDDPTILVLYGAIENAYFSYIDPVGMDTTGRRSIDVIFKDYSETVIGTSFVEFIWQPSVDAYTLKLYELNKSVINEATHFIWSGVYFKNTFRDNGKYIELVDNPISPEERHSFIKVTDALFGGDFQEAVTFIKLEEV